jgi:hypothetical protein
MSNTFNADGKANLAGDLIWGAEQIGQEINLPTRKTFYHLERGNLPGTKVGGLWVSSRQQLRAALLGKSDVTAS